MVDWFGEHRICNGPHCRPSGRLPWAAHVTASMSSAQGFRRSPKLRLHSFTVTCLFQNEEPQGAGASCSGLPTLCARLRSRALEKCYSLKTDRSSEAPRHGKRFVQFKLTLVHVVCSHFFKLQFDNNVCCHVIVRNGL